MAASFTKLKSGDWGIYVDGTAKEGQTVNVSKKDGTTQECVVAKVLWKGKGKSLCAIEQRQKAAASSGNSGRSSRGRRTGCACGSIEGEYHDWYCESCRFDELDQ